MTRTPAANPIADWIGADWGTSNLRAWAMDGAGRVLAEARSEAGMSGLNPNEFEPALLDLVAPWLGPGTTRVVICGMAGARQGWAEAPYQAVPCTPQGAAPVRAPTADARLDVRILCGLCQDAPADVMRGEETQIAGYLAAAHDFDGVLCLPGTHSKWVHVSAGEIVSFKSFMTGELFDLLATRSVLRHGLTGDGWDADGFEAALADAMSRPEAIAARLFSIRAEGLLDGLDPGAARARLSGLLIGAELAAARPYWLGQPVTLIGADRLSPIYAAALGSQGLQPATADAAAMTLGGLAAAHARLTGAA